MNATQALGWALVHFLWQGAALAVGLAAALAVTRPAAARVRYALAVATLAAMLALPIGTATYLFRSAPAFPSPAVLSLTVEEAAATPVAEPRPRPEPAAGVVASHPSTAARTATLSDRIDVALPWLVLLWVAGVLVCAIRLGRGWLDARALRTRGTSPAAPTVVATLERLAARLDLRRPVALLESTLVQVPAVIGWLRPVILLPASALTGLTPQQLELLIAHELAHVRRHDYLVNLAQSVVETLLFYHPAVWWVSRLIREEREHICDDLVVSVCGDPDRYAAALVGMEQLRAAPPQPALAATGGSLLRRVRRLILPASGPSRRELFPTWAAGLIAVSVALLVSVGPRLAESSPAPDMTAAAQGATPDTVIRHPDPRQPLAQRWEWAHTQGRRLDRRGYWIGYRIAAPAWLEHSVYLDRDIAVIGPGFISRGHMFGDFTGMRIPGTGLAALVGPGAPDDVAMFFGFERGSLARVHIASFDLPMHFADRALVWLGEASDAESIPLTAGLADGTRDPGLRGDLIAAVGVHGASDRVVPLLTRWLTGSDAAEARSEAAEWLGYHPVPAAVHALSRAARADADREVRRKAAESLGHSTLAAATDSAIALAETAADPEVRRQAVEALGQQDTERTLAALVAIARSDRDEDVRREAVEALGEMPSGRGLAAVREIARNHPDREVRREAVETLGEYLSPADALDLLTAMATGDADADVQRAAVEALGELKTEAALAAVARFARTHPVEEVRGQAIETYAERAPSGAAVALLTEILGGAAPEDVHQRVLGALEELAGGAGIPALINAARTHPNREVRARALEILAESDDPRARALFEQALRRP